MPCPTRPRRTARTGVTLAGLLLSAGFAVPFTATPAVAEQASPSKALVFGNCLGTDMEPYAENTSSASFNLPRTTGPLAGAADAFAQTAQVFALADQHEAAAYDLTGMNCSMHAQFDNLLHVGAGSSRLPVGTEVKLVATVDYDAVLDETTNGTQKHLTSFSSTGGYTVIDPAVSPWEPIASYIVSADREFDVAEGNWYDDDGSVRTSSSWSHALHSNNGQYVQDGEWVPRDPPVCEAVPCDLTDPAPYAFTFGPQQLVLTTKVGAVLQVSGAVSLYVTAYDGDVLAQGDALDGLSAEVTPAAGYEGLALTLGEAPPPPPLDEIPPVVVPSLSAQPNEGGWHKDPVTVQLDATDAGSDLDSITYAVNGGEPVTVLGDSAPVVVDQDGTTTITYSATDAADNTSEPATTTVKLDGTAPALQLPSGITVGATGASGAVVDHAHTATDALSGVTSQCSPAAGSTFPVGTTTVACTATDGAGNTASGSFPVTVTAQPEPGPQTPAQRIDALQASVSTLQAPDSVKATLDAKLASSERFVAQGKSKQACTHLAQFVQHVEKSTGKGITPANAAALINDARAARTALGC